MRILLININFLFGLQNATFRRFPLVSLLLKRSQSVISSTTETQEEEADGDTRNNHIYFSALKKAALVVFKGIPHWKNILPLANALMSSNEKHFSPEQS